MHLTETLSIAIVTLLRPLVRILLRNGVAYGTFAELAKKAYADVAFDDFGDAGRKQTVSRVSALTGLTRKEVKRLLELPALYDAELDRRYNRAVRVISGWLNDHEFLGADAQPARLPVDGEHGSFAALVRRYSGDIPTQAMLAVLARADCVVREDEGIRLTRHAYIPAGDPIDKVRILGTDVGELVTTIDHNLTNAADLRFQRKVSDAHVASGAVPAFRALSAERAQALLEELDAWLAQHAVGAETADANETPRYVSLGIYYYESEPPAEQ
ncbi:MAG: hypothetical protein HY941_09040 [Gammaproteobacteria bacterium]|nr:hypothetical protein [Gammaproteobacteria bacterium]